MESLWVTIWKEDFWLPKGIKWSDFRSTETIRKPQLEDLYVVLPLAIVLLVVRFVFEKFVARPLCKYINIEDKPRKAPVPNVICEKVFKTVTKNPDEKVIKGLCQQLEWTEFQVKLWFTRRRNFAKLPLMRKATESCWRFLFYFLAFCFGAVVLFRKDWFLQPRHWFIGYVKEQNLDADVKWYYIIELAFYFSLLSSVLIDNKRKDFWEMTIHHFATILLIGSSYTIGHYRIGSVIIILHDASDFWLESAKVANYAKMKRTCDSLFVGFALSFLSTRWIIYPFWVLKYFFKSWEITGMYVSYYWFAILLVLLQISEVSYIYARQLVASYRHTFPFRTGETVVPLKLSWFFICPGLSRHAFYTITEICGHFPVHSIFLILLVILQILHIIWGFAICRVVYQFTIAGGEVRDVRSEDEDEDPIEDKEQVSSSKKKK